MSKLPGRLGQLRARDVMTPSVITLRESDSLAAAMKTLQSRHITGAPVVNDAGRLVGLLSLTDLIDPSDDEEHPIRAKIIPLPHSEDATSWHLFKRAAAMSEEHHESTVESRMSPHVTAVLIDTPLVEVARAMCDGHWHRVPVVDEKEALQGLISSMDVLAAIVNVADEAEH